MGLAIKVRMNYWIISDEHYGHANIIKYCDRPFKNVHEMNYHLMRATRRVMKPDDIMIHLGDVGFGSRSFMENMKREVQAWPGTHIAIRGNHDRKHSRLLQMGFCASFDSLEIVYNGLRILMTHRPRYERPDGVDIVLHGHVHRALQQNLIEANEKPIIPLFNVNMCVDVTDLQPQSLDHAIKRWRKQNEREAK